MKKSNASRLSDAKAFAIKAEAMAKVLHATFPYFKYLCMLAAAITLPMGMSRSLGAVLKLLEKL